MTTELSGAETPESLVQVLCRWEINTSKEPLPELGERALGPD